MITVNLLHLKSFFFFYELNSGTWVHSNSITGLHCQGFPSCDL